MKTFLLVFALIFSGTVAAAPIIPAQYNGIDDSGDSLFTLTDADAVLDDSNFEMVFRFGQFNTFDHAFGLYHYDYINESISSMLTIFDETVVVGDDSNVIWDLVTMTASSMFGSIDLSLADGLAFGLWFKSDGDYYYSQAKFNGGVDHFGLYWETNPFVDANLYVYAVDDGIDQTLDYMELAVNDVVPVAVPEPSVALLAGLGLLMVGAGRFRRR
ncbi:hypothetical protein ACFSJ3_08840 [Corallincola platygyrae]|uniref:PEP-CTERM sorting domain-containing protein n=1 Tax=Corallincola platygyrae TaxID=1193278 RepID=A0ABW4XML7_9GAMM